MKRLNFFDVDLSGDLGFTVCMEEMQVRLCLDWDRVPQKKWLF